MRMHALITAIVASAWLPAIGLAAKINLPGDYTTIQAAIDASADGDVIIVSPGRYIENIDFKGKAIMLTSIDSSNPEIVESTIIDGNQAGPCVRFITGESMSSILMGFTITNGHWIGESGSGIECFGASPLIMDCRIVANQGHRFGGGGIDLALSGACIIRCFIGWNTPILSRKGGGILCYHSDIAIIDCILFGNSVFGDGAAVACEYSSMLISGIRVEGNGGWSTMSSISFYHSTGILTDATISGNTCHLRNVEIGYSSIRISNTTITDNIGAGILAGQDTVIINCILDRNFSHMSLVPQPWNIGVVGAGAVSISHSLISDIEHTVSKSISSVIAWGPGIVDTDPMFVRPGYWDDAGTPDNEFDDFFVAGDYHLLPGSPCIDAGTNDVDNPDTPEVETLPATDISGLRRVIDGDLDGTATVDIGAYEHLPGDVNYDGKVNVLDLLIVRNSLGRDPASSIEARKADVNADGAVNVEDLLLVRGRLGK